MSRPSALSLAAGLVAWSFASPRLPTGWRTPLQAALGAALVVATRAPLGLKPPRLWAGLRLGSAVAAVVVTAIAASTSMSPVRLAMSAREMPSSVRGWLAVQIPLGTVWAEETAFRGALASSGGQMLQAAAFGLSHIPDARATGQPLLPTVLVTGIAGWLFGWLARRCGSLAAPMLVHLAINETGAMAALVIQRRYTR
ncbi:Rv0804 family intramembrane glutamic endopeptidase [Mycobacterium szulgai]|uniref:Rv0804 family intramembrane glutamic endopeptidase n=1 Tax=Mycobacterium szulgai TaxID=1787 RepID=UPI00111C0253|nr:CPBP family intramembrane glutamic endopeptidase [Mycobacterium szulgai]MCV7077393.1 CPBP family intramembrane metalloprotease [Mycobacterium szulgai]